MAKKTGSHPRRSSRGSPRHRAFPPSSASTARGAVMKLSDDAHVQIAVIPTGSIGLDLALGVGGIPPRGASRRFSARNPRARPPSPCTSSPNARKMGGTCAFVDAEHALDVSYAKRLGVNTDELLISQPDYGEQALDIADMLVRSGAVGPGGGGLRGRAHPAGPNWKATWASPQVGGHARLMSHAMRRLTGNHPQVPARRSSSSTRSA